MKIVRDIEKKELRLVEKDEVLFSMNFLFDEFIWSFYTESVVEIDRDTDSEFYDNLDSLMSGKYVFGNNGLSSLENDKLVWFSDQYCNFEDEDSIDRISRLVIKKDNDSFRISMINPFYERIGIKRSKIVSFSPMGNGYFTRNILTNSTFQDDVVINLFWKSLYKDNKQYVKKQYGVLLIEEVNKLEWIDINDNFFDLKKYAGEGNIGHIIEEIKVDLNI